MGPCTDGIRVEKVTDGKISGSAPLVHSKTVEIDSNRPETFTSSSYRNATVLGAAVNGCGTGGC